MDLQWEIAPNNNARPCANERKVSGAKTMASNAKNNAPEQSKQCGTHPVSRFRRAPSRQQKPAVINGERRRKKPRLELMPSPI
jgi:hypothetical protein